MVAPLLAGIGAGTVTGAGLSTGLTLGSIGAGLGSIGSFASGLGSIASGLGLGSSKKRGPSFDDLLTQHDRMITRDIDSKITAAKRHGIHPLSMLGVPSIQGPSFSSGGQQSNIDLEQLGQGIDRAANAGRTGVQRKLDELAIEKAQLSNDYLRVQIAGSQKAIANSGAVPALPNSNRPSWDTATGLNDYLAKWKSDRAGIADGKFAQHKIMVDKHGNAIRVLNTDQVGDNEILMLQDAIQHTFPDMLRSHFMTWGKDKTFKMFKHKPSRKTNFWKKYTPDHK